MGSSKNALVCLLVFNLLTSVFANSLLTSVFACSPDEAIDISDGISQENGSILHKDILYTSDNYFPSNNRKYGCVCRIKSCIQKCCADGQIFVNKSCTDTGSGPRFDLINLESPSEMYFFGGRMCNVIPGVGQKLSLPLSDITAIERDGHAVLSFTNISDATEYCIDADESPENVFMLWCYNGEEDPEQDQSYKSIGMIISMPFLLATFLVYAFLPDRNLPAKALMCYVLSLLFAYILLVTIQLDNGHESTTCIALAFFCYFFFMASFFWMNASCLDIFFTFSGIRGLLGERKKENRRFMYYSAYAWGVPVLLVAFAAFFTFGDIENSNSNFYTGLGNGQCWFRSGWPTGIYFYFPIATLLIINIVLFGITTYKIKKVQRDTKMLKNVDSRKHKYDNNDKQRFNLYVKLLFAMGINWSMEVISWVVLWKLTKVPDYVWILTDFCNAVYGVFIFFIFVFKRNIWMLLKKRYLQLTGRPQQAHTLTSTHRTTFTASLQSLSKSLERKITPACLRYDESDINNEPKNQENQRTLMK